MSISNVKSSEQPSECKTKYRPQKDHSITTSSPTNGPTSLNRKRPSRRKIHRKNKSVDDDTEDDFTVASGSNKRKGYIKHCIKKHLNNNYEKQINCVQDENVVFTDNKIYISLSGNHHSSLASALGTNSLKKNRRVIYPTSGGYKLSGFLRHYDFEHEDKDDSTNQSPAKCSSKDDEMLKFNLAAAVAISPLNNVDKIFEKVKVPSSSSSSANKKFQSSDSDEQLASSFVHVTNCDEEKSDSILTNTTFIAEWNQFDMNPYEGDDEDDIQWQNFLEVRKHSKPIVEENCSEQTSRLLNDSGFGSQLISNSTMVDNNLKTLETWLDDETYDNSFNEELENRVQFMFPDLHKNTSQTAYYNNINNNNHCTDKFS